ncbi:hypothetical protein ACLB2K_047363 [Fragaria x ananassa]
MCTVILIWVIHKPESVIVKERRVSVILLARGKVSMLKQYLPLLSQPIALCSAVGHMYSDLVSVVFSDAKHKIRTELKFTLPGKERQDSVYSGLQLSPDASMILQDLWYHQDSGGVEKNGLVVVNSVILVYPWSCTRCSGKSDHQRAEHVCWLIGAAVLGVPVKATIKEANNESFVVRTLDRRTLWEMQTPQFCLNHTLIALVPKIDGPQHMVNFRPVSLCATIYKVISKVIVARIRPLMQLLISPNQVSYVRGRNISDNDMIAQEMLFKFKKFKATEHQAYGLKTCLDNFCAISGQIISYEKSLIFCSPNTPKTMASSICATCGSPLTSDLGNYLGMPLIHSRVNKHTYDAIFDKVQSRLSSWKSKVLNMAGRLTLIQSVTSAIPNYAMKTTKFPVSLCDRLDKLNRNFLWGDVDDKKIVHLVNWDIVCQPKQLGDLGI